MTIPLFKGIVHPKMKILLSFTLPQVVPNLYKFLSSLGHKRGYFWRILVTKRVMVPIGKKKYYGSQWESSTVCLPTFCKISSFVFSRRKKFIQVWKSSRLSKQYQNARFLVNHPFKCTSKSDHDLQTTHPQSCWQRGKSQPLNSTLHFLFFCSFSLSPSVSLCMWFIWRIHQQ